MRGLRPVDMLKTLANELMVNQTSVTITIVTWKISLGNGVGYELEPLKCEPNGQHIVILDMARLSPTFGIEVRLLKMFVIT